MGDLFRISQIKNKEILTRILNGEYFSDKSISYSAFYSESMENNKLNRLDFKFRETEKHKENNNKIKKEIKMQNNQIEWKINQLNIKLKKDKISNKVKQWFKQDIFQNIKQKNFSEDELFEKKKINPKKHANHIPENTNFFSDLKINYSKDKSIKKKEKQDVLTDLNFLKKERRITGIFNSGEVSLKKYDGGNSDSIPEVLNIGKQFLNKKRTQKLIDSSYNKYFYDDSSGISDWNVKEEIDNKFLIPNVDDKDHNSKFSNKILQAKFRKKCKLVKQWKGLKKKTNMIAEKWELTERQKMKEIQKLLNKTTKKKSKKLMKRKNVLQFSNRYKKAKGVKKKFFDLRMKKDFNKNQHKKKET